MKLVLLSSSIKPNFVPTPKSDLVCSAVSLALLATTSSAMSTSNPTAPSDASDDLQNQEDEQLAQAIQRRLNVEPPPRYCYGCVAEIGHGRFLNCLYSFWHPHCFKCHECKRPITDNEFSMTENYTYHKSCYKQRRPPKCDVCKCSLRTDPATVIVYRSHPSGEQKHCLSHERDGTPQCSSCKKMKTPETEYTALDDGGKLCPECQNLK